MKTNKYILVAILLFSLIFSGCSLLGLGAGIYLSADEEVFNKESRNLPTIQLNEAIRVITTSNDTISGNFIGISRMLFDDYLEKYKEAIKQLNNSICLPQLGEEITYTRIIKKSAWQQT